MNADECHTSACVPRINARQCIRGILDSFFYNYTCSFISFHEKAGERLHVIDWVVLQVRGQMHCDLVFHRVLGPDTCCPCDSADRAASVIPGRTQPQAQGRVWTHLPEKWARESRPQSFSWWQQNILLVMWCDCVPCFTTNMHQDVLR